MYHFNKRRILCCCATVACLIILFVHSNNVSNQKYDYIIRENILNSLHKETADNFTSTAYIECDYYDIVYDDTALSMRTIDEDLEEAHKIKEGGEYSPTECKPKYSTAVIVPYRDRAEQLRGFLVYMHSFLHHQRIHYRIYVIEQVDTHPFNRAKLLNIGALTAMRAGYPCLVLHDVDLLPVMTANMYACVNKPRHMSSNINSIRYAFPYLNIFGGAISILTKQFKNINGMNNNYYGTSNNGDNDDLFSRIEAADLKLCRFDPETSQYHITGHDSVNEISPRQDSQEFSKEQMRKDGLNSIKYTEVATVLHPLFTHIMVDL